MYECIIVYRDDDGHVKIVLNADSSIAVFLNLDEAIAYGDGNTEFKRGTDFQIVELDEL